MNKCISHIPHAHNIKSKLPYSGLDLVDMLVETATQIPLSAAKAVIEFCEWDKLPFLLHCLQEEQDDAVIGRGKIEQDIVHNDGAGGITVGNAMALNMWP